MRYEYKNMPASASNYGGRRTAEQIKYITVHYTGNQKDTAEANARYFQMSGRNASAHYFVSGSTVVQSVDDLSVAWAVGGKKWSDCATTGGGKLYGTVCNTNSISVEICADGNGEPSRTTLRTAVRLIRELQARYTVPSANLCRHFDVNGKHCPQWLLSPFAWRLFVLAVEATD